MNLQFVLAIVSGLMCYSPTIEEPKMLVAQFNLYVDANAFKDGEPVTLSWEARIDHSVYKNDCEGFYDLSTLRYQICDPTEIQAIYELFKKHEQKDPFNLNRL